MLYHIRQNGLHSTLHKPWTRIHTYTYDPIDHTTVQSKYQYIFQYTHKPEHTLYRAHVPFIISIRQSLTTTHTDFIISC